MPLTCGHHALHKILKIRNLYNAYHRGVTLQTRNFVSDCNVEHQHNRGLLSIYGNEASAFIQGLITNDVRHLDEGSPCLFTMILNTKGRVLYDAIIYKRSFDHFLVECDVLGREDLQKHFKMFRVRRKVEIELCNDKKIWSLFSPHLISNLMNTTDNTRKDCFYEEIIKSINSENNKNLNQDSLICAIDPRLQALGIRILAPSDININSVITSCGIKAVSSSNYKLFRYKLGVGEGVEELPIGKCFPLEANCDYLHGVSFHKGCYIGQEVTARTHHTGVVRKRLMPLMLDSSNTNNIALESSIEDVTGSKTIPIGKVRGIEQDTGIGLMRVAEALQLETFKIGNITGRIIKPFWWPQEMSKDRMDTKA